MRPKGGKKTKTENWICIYVRLRLCKLYLFAASILGRKMIFVMAHWEVWFTLWINNPKFEFVDCSKGGVGGE